MRIRSDDKASGPSITRLNHYLMTNPSTSFIEIYSMLFCELFYLLVLFEIRFRLILHIMIQRHHDLARIRDLGGANGHELECYWPRVVMAHTIRRRDSHEIPSPNILALLKADSMTLYNLLCERLWRMRRFDRGENSCSRGIL